MTSRLNLIVSCIICFVLLLGILLPITNVQANGLQGYSVSPMNINKTGKQGETLTAQITVYNDREYEAKVIFEANDFTAENGNIRFLDDLHENYSLAKWTSFDQEEYILPANSRETIEFKINIPKEAEMGEHVVLVSVAFSPVDPSGQVKVVTEILPVMYVLVTDEHGNINIIRDWDIVEYHTKRINGNSIGATINNTGNVHLITDGSVTITNVLTKKEEEIELPNAHVLPNSSREVSVPWLTEDLFGIYRAEIQMTTKDGERSEQHSTTLFIIPWGLFILVLVAIGALAFVVKVYLTHMKQKYMLEAKKQALAEISATEERSNQ